MKSVMLFFAFAISFTFLIKMRSACFIGLDQTSFIDRINNDRMIWQSQVLSVLACLRQCFRLTSCMSFFYNEMTNICSLQGIVYLFVEQATTEVGSRYFVTFQVGNCPGFGGFMHNRALGLCYNFKCCEPYNITDFRARCHSAGASLIKIDSADKQDHIQAFLEQGASRFTLIQGTRDEDTDAYTYDDGTPMTYFYWDISGNEPEQRPGEINIVLNKDTEFLWHDSVDFVGTNIGNLVCETPIQ